MHCLAGLDTVTSGQIYLDDTEITGLKDKKLTRLRRDRIGFIFQAFNLLPTLNAIENITLPMDIAGRKPDKAWLDRVVETVGLADRLKHRPTQLSGGQQQRVAVARALAARPEIIFGDEPTGNLDSRAAPRCSASCAARSTSWARPSSWSPTTRSPPPTRTACCTWPTAASSTRCTSPPPSRSSTACCAFPAGTPRPPTSTPGAHVMTVLKTSLRNFFAHKGRMALSAVAVLLSVAFVCGTLVFTDTMGTTFDKLFAATASDVTVSSKDADEGGETSAGNGRPQVIPASVVDEVKRADGVKEAEGAVFSTAVTVIDGDRDNLSPTSGAPTVVGSWNSNDARTMDITSGAAPKGPGQIMLDADTAEKHDLGIGDELSVITALGTHTAKISGIADFAVTNPGAAVFYFDTPTAQKVLTGETGVYTDVNVTAAEGVSDDQLKQNVVAELGGGYKVLTAKETAEANQKDVESFMNVMEYAMLGFAGIAFLVGIFLIINTFSMLVAQRTREIGLMRAIGSSRRQVNRSVLIEALLLGVVGSVLGVGAGVGLAVGLMKLMGAIGMELSTDDLTVAWTTPRSACSSAWSSPSSPPTCRPAAPGRSPRWPRCATPAPRRTAAPAGSVPSPAWSSPAVGRPPSTWRAQPRRPPKAPRGWASGSC